MKHHHSVFHLLCAGLLACALGVTALAPDPDSIINVVYVGWATNLASLTTNVSNNTGVG